MWRPVSAKFCKSSDERAAARRPQREEAFPKSHIGSCCVIGPIGSLHSDILAPVSKRSTVDINKDGQSSSTSN